ncbi:hypothetical protein [Spongiactinospora sp. TRM90649]|uniref:hypothetical protein n=1 Tax=Spongiactinospora sp. TRM90649 TaxID=3031114 RepID=UPI0023F98DCB|nr:hypothetical protein [Spongiactinospora sp. TRM90649]MDF5753378.1 hypothetical protein [Spongiactinospora sp. TRM90649]
MSTAFAATVRERAWQAAQALRAARQGDDADAVLVAEGEWEDVRRLAAAHGVDIRTAAQVVSEEASPSEIRDTGPAGEGTGAGAA